MFYRSQKTSQFHKDQGLYLHHQGTSRAAMNSGPILGYSIAPRTFDRFSLQIQRNHPNVLSAKVQYAINVSVSKMCDMEIFVYGK